MFFFETAMSFPDDKQLLQLDFSKAEELGEVGLSSFLTMVQKQIANLEHSVMELDAIDDLIIMRLTADPQGWREAAKKGRRDMIDTLTEWEAAAQEKLGHFEPKRSRRTVTKTDEVHVKGDGHIDNLGEAHAPTL
ncbi:hypothetical protein HDE_04465 [Halotydeus destructor]|nr:hypothetical protein HDE_04465 [Halotydeus destructor]